MLVTGWRLVCVVGIAPPERIGPYSYVDGCVNASRLLAAAGGAARPDRGGLHLNGMNDRQEKEMLTKNRDPMQSVPRLSPTP